MINHLHIPANPKFLGVHFTRMINGGRGLTKCCLALKREGYKNTDFSFLIP